MAFKIAIIGRPNVGKSTLFNRLIGKRHALVDDTPGVTRDRREGDGRIADLNFTIVDTAGLEDATDDSLEARMRRQTELAVTQADLVFMMIDARAGVTPLDSHFAGWLRKTDAKVVLVANKCEGRGGISGLAEAYRLGLGDPIALSAEHGEGLGDLYDTIAGNMKAIGHDPHPEETDPYEHAAPLEADVDIEELLEVGISPDEVRFLPPPEDGPLRLAVIGRPNVGKSTLINKLIG